MEDEPKSFWGHNPDLGERRTSPYDALGLREEADLIRLFTLNHIRLVDAEGMELWELASACGTYLGPTAEEQKIQDMYAQEEELKAAMIERAKRRGDYASQDMPDVRVHGAT